MSQYCDHIDVAFCERDSFEAIFDDAPDYVGFAQAVTSTRILGYFASVEALTEAVPNPNIGDTYGIGEEAPYNLYVYSANGWIDNGAPIGPPGPPGPQGNDGAQGPPGPAAAVTAWEVKYQASTSGTTIPTGTWSVNIPEVPDGQSLWTRTEVTYNDGTTTTSYSVGRGVRGVGLLNITTAPSSYTTETGGFKPTYRIALSTVKSQSGATEVLVGDTLLYSYYAYPVRYVDASYVYTAARVSIRGATGSAATVSVGSVTTGEAGSSATVTNSGTTEAAVLDFVIPKGDKGDKGNDGSDAEVTAENIETALGFKPLPVSNPNLLDNWWFGTGVINQKNITNFILDATGIDRWKLVSGSASVTENGILLNGTIEQTLENYVGTNVHARTLMYSGAAASSYDDENKIFSITSDGGIVKAAKLEYGTTSTIANDHAPDFAHELLKCQRFLLPLSNYVRYPVTRISQSEIDFMIPIPIRMRATPSIDGTITIYSGTTAQSGFTITIASAGSNALAVRGTKSSHGLTVASNLCLQVSSCMLNAEL